MTTNPLQRIGVLAAANLLGPMLQLELDAQGREGFEHLTASGISYESGSYSGDEGRIWTFAGARAVRSTYHFEDTSIGFGTDSTGDRFIETNIEQGGIGELSFVIGPYFSSGGAQDRSVVVWVDEVTYGPFSLESMEDFRLIEITGIDNPAPLALRIEAVGPRQVIVDAIAWTAHSSSAEDPPNSVPEEPVLPELEANPWRSDSDFLALLLDRLPGGAHVDPAVWELARSEKGELDRERALEICMQLEPFERLERLYLAVRFLEGRFPGRGEWDADRDAAVPAFVEYLEHGDWPRLVEQLVMERDAFRLRMGGYDPHEPRSFWSLVWLHWADALPSEQQLVQLDFRMQDLFFDGEVDAGLATSRFLAAFALRQTVGGQPLIHRQPPAYFEESLQQRVFADLTGMESFEQNSLWERSYRYADSPLRFWAHWSHPEVLVQTGLGRLGSVAIEDRSWYWHPVYGWLYDPDPAGFWIYAETMGWFGLPPLLAGQCPWFYHSEEGWLWTCEETFPWVVPADGREPFRLSFSH